MSFDIPRIVAIQTNSSDDIAGNLTVVENYIGQARQQGCELIVLPECFGFMQSNREQLLQCAEQDGRGRIQDFLAATAKRHNVWIIGGSLPLKSAHPNKVTNTTLTYDNNGNRVARYDKIFLFDVTLSSKERYCESDYTQPGDSFVVIDSPLGKIGFSICYDLRFPELYRKLADLGAQILVVPAAFSYTTGQRHWLPLLKARAIENGCFMIAAAQTGVHQRGHEQAHSGYGMRETWGHTVIIDPWGEVLAEMESECGIVGAEIDLSKLHDTRKQLPCRQHYRPDLFQN